MIDAATSIVAIAMHSYTIALASLSVIAVSLSLNILLCCCRKNIVRCHIPAGGGQRIRVGHLQACFSLGFFLVEET